MSHVCKCGQTFLSAQMLQAHQSKTDCMLEKYSIVDLYLTAKKVNEQEASDFVKRCHTEIVAAMNKGDYYASVEYEPMLGRLKELIPRVKKLFAGIRIRPDTETKTLDFEWGVEDVLNAEESVTPAIFHIGISSVKLGDLIDKLNITSVTTETPWTNIKKGKFIDSIMSGYPVPMMYMIQDDDGLHCLQGHNRLSALLDYINQQPQREKAPVAWHIIPKVTKEELWNKWIGQEKLPQSGTYVYYKETPVFAAYVSEMNAKETGNTYRFMTGDEQAKFKNYMFVLTIIHGNLTYEERDFIDKKLLNDENIGKFCIGSKNISCGKEDGKMFPSAGKYHTFSKKLLMLSEKNYDENSNT
jgi:hypothetical protein